MKKILHILTIILLPLTVFGQKEYLSRLSISGGVSELGISPSEEIWVATKAGNVYFTKQIGELWNMGPYGSLDPYNFSSGKTFERLNFFSEDTLMISGFIQEGGKQDFVFWSGNHGKTWEKVIFGKSSWIDAAYINNNGKAWMSGNSQLIYYTEDKGKTWKAFDKAGNENALRFSTIHFAKDEQTGLFGSFWNVLYKTTDNCQSWEKLPTPLSQGKYERLSKEERPDIRKIRIFGNYYIINQQGRVFITKSDSIDWTYLPEIIDFEVSEINNLYTINQDLSISHYDNAFSQTWQSEESLENNPRAIGVRNNKLFVLTFESIYKINPDDFIVSQLFTDEVPIQEPYLKLSFEGEEYGFENKDILRFDKKKKQWYRFMTLDFSIANASLFESKIVLADRSLNKLYTLDPKEKSVNEYSLPESLFSNLVVKELHFENGSQGCFHSDNSLRTYNKKGDKYVVDKKTKSSKYLSRADNEIEVAKIERIINVLDKSRFSNVSLTDLNITENDIKEFKKFIDKEEQRINKSGIDRFDFENLYIFPGEKTDFNFYKSVADSLFTLSDEEINNAFWQSYGNWSTTTDWRRIIIVFQNGKKLIIENSDDKPNYLYTPWIVDFEGLKFQTNSILFGQQIDEITNGQFFNEVARDKNYAIFKIADYLYKKKLNEK
ncbi:WD40/YVTN/BNR-like repeat-containing protein [Croceibacter atlanticus]|uniref:WD40/YVTN/BNR-like repeat-containing protein n=1 Tax=Croceibacter atlanticus TaxID=313588 RepID=UPI0024BB227E|nr:YCF48-related protein [Croceibacter atlanticus]